MLGQVLQVGQEQESKHNPVPTAVSAAGFVTSHISSANREPTRPLPPNCPPWAARLKHVEVSWQEVSITFLIIRTVSSSELLNQIEHGFLHNIIN